jgi:hypothetical protein
MSVINLSFEHGQSLEQARSRLGTAVNEVQKLFGVLVQRVSWNDERSQARIDGVGFWLEMAVDAKHLHATGDIPMLAGLLGGPMANKLTHVVEQSFQKKLT